MPVIDTAQHAPLVALQVEVFKAFDRLEAFAGDDAEPVREETRQAVTAKEAALYASGLVGEWGYYAAAQALKQAAREEVAG